MEATALGRGSLSQLTEAAGRTVRARSRVFWVVVGLTTLAAALRLATLGLQSYHHDEVVTASRLLRGDLWHVLEKVGSSESAPPLYYLLGWLWTQVTGTGEVGLRSLSALAGIATVPVAYLIGEQLRDRRAGVVAAALVATSPMLIWYSQEARAYSLLVLLGSVALLYLLRALRGGSRRDMALWAVASALAIATHYFAIFPAAAGAVWLVARHRGGARRAVVGVGAACALLAPLAVFQASHVSHTDWIERLGLTYRIGQAGVAFMVGETGQIIAQPVRPLLAVVPAVLLAALLLLVALRGSRDERAPALLLLSIAAAMLLAPLALAFAGKDFLIARNLIPALVPLLCAAALGATVRRARAAGTALCATLVAYSLGFAVWANFETSLQRPDFRAVAERLGEPTSPRAMVTWMLGAAPLRDYLATGSFQVAPEGERWYVHEVNMISDGPLPRRRPAGLTAGFRRTDSIRVGRFRITRFTTPGLAQIRIRRLNDTPIGFRSTRVLLDGIGPTA